MIPELESLGILLSATSMLARSPSQVLRSSGIGGLVRGSVDQSGIASESLRIHLLRNYETISIAMTDLPMILYHFSIASGDYRDQSSPYTGARSKG